VSFEAATPSMDGPDVSSCVCMCVCVCVYVCGVVFFL